MKTRVAGFEWDRGNREKCQQHGVSIREIESAFEKPIAVVPDPAHSRKEERLKAIGTTRKAGICWWCSRCASGMARR